MNSAAVRRRQFATVSRQFLEDFSREMKTSIELNTDKAGSVSNTLKQATFSGLHYKVKFNVPSRNIEEAKKNAAKIQYLIRLFFKIESYTSGGLRKSQNNEGVLKFYIPEMVEKAGASVCSHTSFTKCFNNSINANIDSLVINMNDDMGFFNEDGKFYPKAYSIEIGFIVSHASQMQNYRVDYTETSPGKQTADYYIDEAEAPAHYDNIGDKKRSLFPFNVKYTKVYDDI